MRKFGGDYRGGVGKTGVLTEKSRGSSGRRHDRGGVWRWGVPFPLRIGVGTRTVSSHGEIFFVNFQVKMQGSVHFFPKKN